VTVHSYFYYAPFQLSIVDILLWSHHASPCITLYVCWASDCCLTPKWAISSYVMARTSYIIWDDDDVRFRTTIL